MLLRRKAKAAAQEVVHREGDHKQSYPLLRQGRYSRSVNFLRGLGSEPVSGLLDFLLDFEEPSSAFAIFQKWGILKHNNCRFSVSEFAHNPDNLEKELTSLIVEPATFARLREALTWKSGVQNVDWLETLCFDTNCPYVFRDQPDCWKIMRVRSDCMRVILNGPCCLQPLFRETFTESPNAGEKCAAFVCHCY